MPSSSVIVNNGLLMMQNRIYNAAADVDYLEPSRFRIGLGTTTSAITNTAIETPVPIENGTVIDNGSNPLTGSNGADNSTDNIVTFKEGAGQVDAQSQNLLADAVGPNATKTWTLTPLTANFTGTQPVAFWLYILNAAALAKFVAAGTALSMRIRTNLDAANRYYELARTRAQLAAGWNWVSSGTTIVTGLTQGAGGAPSGAMNEFIIEITTVAAGDTFAAGDVLYDIMRQWSAANLVKIFETSYPTYDTTNYETTIRCRLSSTQANGFNVSEFGVFNNDATPLMNSHSNFTAGSKSSSDEIIFIERHKLTQL